MKRTFALFASLLCVLTSPASAAALASPTRESTSGWLRVGDRLNLKDAANLRIENREVLEGMDGGEGLSVRGKALGSSWIHTRSESRLVHVISYAQWRLLPCLEKELKKSMGLKLDFQDGRIAVTGSLYRFHEWKNLSGSCPSKDTWRASFSVSPELRKEIQQAIHQELSGAGYPSLALRWEPFISLRSPEGAKHPSQFKSWASRWGLDVVEESGLVDVAPQIHIRLLIAEVKSDFSRKIGINWSDSYRAQVLGEKSAETELSQVFAQAHFLESNGLGQTLARPELLARSGQTAEFWAGGEFPVILLGHKTREVMWKKYGILLKVKPKADHFGQMQLQIEAEISNIDMGTAVGGVPGISISRVQTEVDLLQSQTIALSGLIRQLRGQKTEGLPGLSSIPILGKLFGSDDFRKSRSELIILVRPEIMKQGGGNYAQSGNL